MKSKPLISVIITNYNYGQYVTKAIKSVLTQTYPNIELIIINDGSTDDSDEVIKEVIAKNPERNIRYVSRANKGVVYTRNEGLRLAKGEYLCFLDADDYFNRSYISKSYKIAKEYDADVVYPNWHFVGEWLGRPDTDFPEFKPELLQLQKLHVTPASLTRKSSVRDRRFEVEKVAEDWDFFIGLSLDGAKFKLAKDNYINYRIRKGTRGSKNDPKEDTRYFVEILNKYKKQYGDQVIDPAKLVSLRHPNIVMRALRTRIPRTLIESIRKDGTRATAKKVLKKVASRNQKLWKILWYTRNQKYQKILRSVDIEKSPKTKLAIVVHLYYPDLWPVVKEKLASIDVPFDVFVSVQMQHKDVILDRVNENHKMTNIIALPNRGRDTLPFLMISRMLREEKQYKYILKLHSKKSPHRDDGNEWLNSLLTELVPANVSSIIRTLEKADTGAIGPASHVVSLSKYMGGNKKYIGAVLEKITETKITDHILDNPSKYPFFGGTMFWCRVDFLSPLLDSSITPADFNTENGQVDATTAHAVERVLGKALHTITNKEMYIVKKGVVNALPAKHYRAKYKHVE